MIECQVMTDFMLPIAENNGDNYRYVYLIYSFKEKNLRLQVPLFTNDKNIGPATNHLNIKYRLL